MSLLALLWLLPLAGAIVIWAFGPQLGRTAGALGSAVVFASFVAALMLFGGATAAGGVHQTLVTWIPGFAFGLSLDPLSLLWALIITGVGGLIHVYSIGYMWSDKAIARFFAYLNFFVFAMLTLVLSDNVVGLLVGWGLVGLASYFLIGFWFFKPSAVAAAKKAFVINVFGDVGIMFAVFVLFAATGSIAFADIFAKAPTLSTAVILAACIGLFVGAAAKSAQVPLHTWLPDAMEGPTPVSALIHAATMVTAGVYLIARFAPLFNATPAMQEAVGIVGALTMVTGAVLGVAQWDIKRVLAYSTMSQIGYMIMGVGTGAYEAGVLHFFTHAFFKAELFLTAGLVIHALHDEQDMRKMGGLWKRMPFATWAMLAGTLAIIGFPGLAGYFSKDAIVYGTLEHGHPILWALGVLTAGITAYYMFRMFFITFFGPYRGDDAAGETGTEGGHAADHGSHAPAWIMNAPVAVLIVPTVCAGYLNLGLTGGPTLWQRFFATQFPLRADAAASSPFIPELASTFCILAVVTAGIIVAYLRYGAPAAQLASIDRLQAETNAIPQMLRRAFYFDDVIEALIVKPSYAIGKAISNFVDPHVIDAGVRDVVWVAGALGVVFRRLQTGLLRGYALTVVAGAAAFIAYFALLGAAR